MRLWSLHPKYLDPKGLTACWREGLLAQAVLMGKTKGYKNHPQLDRFKNVKKSLDAIGYYLLEIYNEADSRGYNFDTTKIKFGEKIKKMAVTDGQIYHEVEHLKIKLKVRDPKRLKIIETKKIKIHPLFRIIKGPLEQWERILKIKDYRKK